MKCLTRVSRLSDVCRVALGLVALAAISGCGGGGGEPASATSPAAAGASSAPPLAPVTALASSCGITNFAGQLLAQINQLRAAGATCGTQIFAPASALAWNVRLTQAAQGHSQDMVETNLFSHTGSSGSTLASRVSATGYSWDALGENIAAGQVGIDSVMAAWIDSPDHCANLMNPTFVDVGVACVAGTASDTYPTYWTMDLGHSP
jgi:uncharacterized protein YkwD